MKRYVEVDIGCMLSFTFLPGLHECAEFVCRKSSKGMEWSAGNVEKALQLKFACGRTATFVLSCSALLLYLSWQPKVNWLASKNTKRIASDTPLCSPMLICTRWSNASESRSQHSMRWGCHRQPGIFWRISCKTWRIIFYVKLTTSWNCWSPNASTDASTLLVSLIRRNLLKRVSQFPY